MVGGVAVAGPIADEDDGAAGLLVAAHPFALAGPAHEAGRVAVGEADPGAALAEHGGVGGHGQVLQAQAREHAFDVEAHAVADDLDGGAGLAHDAHQVVERLVQWHGVHLAEECRGVARQDLHVPGDELPRALEVVDVELVHAPDLVLVLDEAGQQDVADVLEADGAVEVDEHADGCAAGSKTGCRAATLTGSPLSRLPTVARYDEAGPCGPAPVDSLTQG